MPFFFKPNFLKIHPTFLGTLVVFLLLNFGFYLNIFFFHDHFPISPEYFVVHRYIIDPRINYKAVNFLTLFNQSDAQWFLHIAEFGYPYQPSSIQVDHKLQFDGLAYMFFPVFPMLLATVNFIVHDVQLSAFLTNNVLLVLNFVSLYYILKKLKVDSKIASKTCLLFFFTPFSFFFRSFHSESIFLFLMLWFYFFFTQKMFRSAALLLGFSIITRGNSLLLIPIFLFEMIKVKVSKKVIIFSLTLCLLPLLGWVAFNFVNTYSPLYFIIERKVWISPNLPLRLPLVQNLYIFASFFSLPFYLALFSKIDILVFICLLGALLATKKMSNKKIWRSELALMVTPLLFATFASYARYCSVLFQPLIFLAKKTPSFVFFGIVVVNYVLLNFLTLLFINGYWLG